jgi:ribosomal protein S17
MTQQEQKEHLSNFQRQMSETIISKASDYATEDVLSNFKLVAQMTNLSVEKVIDVFLATKVIRKCNLTGSQASNESTDDTLLDLANYGFLATLKDENKVGEFIPRPPDFPYSNYETDLARAKEQEIKVGDMVRIKQHTNKEKNNYKYGWENGMDIMEGNVFPVESIDCISDDLFTVYGWVFSIDSLEKVEDDISDYIYTEKELKAKNKKNKIKRGDIVCILDNYIEIIPQDILSQVVDLDKISLPKIGQIAEVIGKAKNSQSKYLMLAYHEEIYILEKHQVIKTYPQAIIL